MKATFRIVTPAAAVSAAAAALLLTGCADKPVRVPGGAFYDEPYQGGSGAASQAQAQPVSSGEEEIVETEIIYIENDVPVGPVEDNGESAGQGQAGSQQVQDQQPEVLPVETAKSNVPEGSVEYKVVKGDTLWGIGMVYGVSVQRLAEINGIDEKAPLKVGQVLMIPPDAKNAVGKPIPEKKADTKAATSTAKPADNTKKTTTTISAKPVAKEGESLYVVKSGDSLSVIAQRHHVKLADLVAANKIDPKATLRIGQTLVIPAASASAASTTKTSTATASTTTKPAETTKPATTTTKPATTTPAASSTTTQPKAGEGTGGVVEPIGGSSSGVTTPSTTTSTPAASSASSTLPALDPVSEVPDLDVISVPIDSELTLEEVANIHDRNLQDLIRLNPDFKPGQKIPAGTTVRMPLF